MAKLKVSGEYVTEAARNMYWKDKCSYKEAERFLLGFLSGVEQKEQKKAAKDILEGKKRLEGINTFSLVEDGGYIRTISPISVALHEKKAYESVKEDVENCPWKYIDWYAVDKSWRFFQGFTREDIWQYAYTDMSLIAAKARKQGVFFVKRQQYIGEKLDLSECYDDSCKEVLDHGAYLIYNPRLVYELLKEPINDENRQEFYDRLFDYLESSEMKDDPVVRKRQNKYLNAMKKRGVMQRSVSAITEDADAVFTGKPDKEFSSKYGIIDTEGNWYGCKWSEHSLKAKYILIEKRIVDANFSLDECLDKAVDLGYVLIRDMDLTGTPCVQGNLNEKQKKTLKKYQSHFGQQLEQKTFEKI